ncbi:beta-1,3-galactosyltransferase 5-like [Mixophyes fleayi]|uniref:beta-1,3-galactosyltransferase 5-like n=1 Tax=Mixophyes fleayi TaxID=3061075 RepID=UPI003F4E0066
MKYRKVLITAVLFTVAIFLATEWIRSTDTIINSKRPVSPKIWPVVRQSVTLNDGHYDYHLNLTSFEAEFPHLQSYQCAFIHRPREEPQGDITQPLLILAIKSHPGSGHRRAPLRQTWAREQEINGYRLRPIFLVGMTASSGHMEMVKSESHEYEDILQWDIVEGHHNLSLKERCFLEWLHDHLTQVAFIFKGDDDMFVNPEAVVQYITEHSAPDIVHGFHFHRPTVLRNTKYRIARSLYPMEKYPGFVSGGGFIFPGPSVKALSDASKLIPVFPLDDVYFGFLVLAVNLTYRHDNRFHVRGLQYDECKYKNALVVHGIQSQRLVHIWKVVQKSNCTKRVAVKSLQPS